MGDCVFKLPYKLEGGKIYVLTLSMETATLIIRTKPSEAEIYVDNQKVGTGEAVCPVSIGDDHRYKVVCDLYYTQEGTVKFSKREEKTITVELEPNFGYVSIKTEPSGADVYIDEQKVGKTPYLMKKVLFGTHVVELKKIGYEDHAEVLDIQRGEVNKQLENVTLTAKPVINGTLSITSTPDGADITLDGEYMGRTPQTFDVLVGEYKITLTKKGYTPDSKTVVVNENLTTEVNIYLKSGKEIVISSDANGDKIYVDGKYMGDTPLTAYMDCGEHEVKAMRGSRTMTKKLTVTQTMASNTLKFVFPVGAGQGVFTVAPGKQVVFSPGVLQYNKQTKTWRFAETQLKLNNEGEDGWMSGMAWGTSGYNDKWPDVFSQNDLDYGDGEDKDIAGTNYDWGVYCTISNSDDKGWRTLTIDELRYLFTKRNTQSGVLFARAKVNNVSGIILLPDNWKTSYYQLNDVNLLNPYYNKTSSKDNFFEHNIISLQDWTEKLEANGAIFMPTSYFIRGSKYWSSTNFGKIKKGEYGAYTIEFTDSWAHGFEISRSIAKGYVPRRQESCYVRLVRDVK